MRALAPLTILAECARARNAVPVALLVAAIAAIGAPVLAGQLPVLQISAVLASKEHHEFDPRLESLRPELRGLPFKGYTLLGIQSCRLDVGDHCAMDIPGGGYLHLTTTQTTDEHLKMRVILNQQNRPILNADVKLDRNAGILLKSVRTGVGVIILSIKTCDAPAAATAARTPE